jgi:hypothetical protein
MVPICVAQPCPTARYTGELRWRVSGQLVVRTDNLQRKEGPEMKRYVGIGATLGFVLLLGMVGWNLAGPTTRVRAFTSATPSTTPTPTSDPCAPPPYYCTPPACATDEVLHCPTCCPHGCGVVCATRTPTPDSSPPLAVPETSSLVLLGLGASALTSYVALQIRARSRKGSEGK